MIVTSEKKEGNGGPKDHEVDASLSVSLHI
jgi:hypothetical protein